MRKTAKRITGLTAAVLIAASAGISSANADAAKPGQSMTHIKTLAGITATLENAGVIIYVQGGATAGVMGESIGSSDGQMVMHVPVTGTKTGVEHVGSNIVFFNTANNKQVQLRNPLIDLKKGVINTIIPQSSNQAIATLAITNGSELKAKVTNDRKTQMRTTAYAGAKLSLAPGIAAALASLLGLPEGSLPEGLAFATADVTLYSKIPAKK
jgi:hypothetical protein